VSLFIFFAACRLFCTISRFAIDTSNWWDLFFMISKVMKSEQYQRDKKTVFRAHESSANNPKRTNFPVLNVTRFFVRSHTTIENATWQILSEHINKTNQIKTIK
jgi:hypothetical protein